MAEDMLAPQSAEDEFKKGIADGTPAPAATGGRPPKPAGSGYGYGWVWSDMTQKWIPKSPPPPTGDAPSSGTTAAVASPAEVRQLGSSFAALAPKQNPGIKAVTNSAQGIQGEATTGVNAAADVLMAPMPAPVVTDPRNVQVGKAPAPVLANTSASGAQYDRAVGAAGGFEDVQAAQGTYLDQLRTQAAGQGPSVAGAMVAASGAENAYNTEKAVADANAQYGEHSREAVDAYGQAASQAALDYANAFGDQQAAMEAAALNASQQTRMAAEDAIRASAALTAGARGSNIGSALLSAQGNAAQTMAQAGRTVADNEARQRLEASAQAAAAGRQTAYGRTVANATTGTMQSTADAATTANQQQAAIASSLIKAKADIEAGRVLSEEQMNAIAQLGIGIKDLQGMTNDEVMAQVNIGNLGAGIDTAITNASISNAEMALEARAQDIGVQEFDIGQETGIQAGNADRAVNVYGIDTQAATSVLNTQAGREAMALAAQGDMAALAGQLNMTEAELGAHIFTAAQGLGMEYDKMDRAERTALISGIMSGGATLGAAAIMGGK